MLRFRNPGTQYSTQVQVIKQLYAALGHQESFSLNDMAVVIAQGRLMTAYGYAGDDAIRLSMTDQESMNSECKNVCRGIPYAHEENRCALRPYPCAGGKGKSVIVHFEPPCGKCPPSDPVDPPEGQVPPPSGKFYQNAIPFP